MPLCVLKHPTDPETSLHCPHAIVKSGFYCVLVISEFGDRHFGKELTLPPISCSLHALPLDAASALSFVKLSQACCDAQFAMLFNTTQI